MSARGGQEDNMKIVVPIENETEDSNINPSLGRAPYYLLYDTETEAAEIIANTSKDSPSGAGVAAAQLMIDAGAEVLLTPRCGDRAYAALKGAGIKIMLLPSGTAKSGIAVYLEGGLSELDTVVKGHHGAH